MEGLDRTGARRNWLIWAAVIPVVLWGLARAFGLEAGSLLTSLMFFTPFAAAAADLPGSDHRAVHAQLVLP